MKRKRKHLENKIRQPRQVPNLYSCCLELLESRQLLSVLTAESELIPTLYLTACIIDAYE